MSTTSQPSKPCVPDAPGLWWVNYLGKVVVGEIVDWGAGVGLMAHVNGNRWHLENDKALEWLAPIASLEESNRHREALEQIVLMSHPLIDIFILNVAKNALSAKGDGK